MQQEAGQTSKTGPMSISSMMILAFSAMDSSSGQAINYVTGATYDATNALTGSAYGQNGSFSGIVNSFSFNNRLQSATLWSSSPTRTLMYLAYDFYLGNGDNGNVYAITNNRDLSRNQTFTYDPLNRLLSAQNAGTDCNAKLPDGHTEYWGNSYVYDAWGNLNQKQVTKCSAENLSVTVAANNQLLGVTYVYDSAGNMTRDNNGASYVYDSENRIGSTTGFNYTYDADGNRVKKANGTTGTLYWYMSLGIVGESDLTGNLQSEYVFFDGERVARKDYPGNAVSYYFSDHLKTASVITDATGNIRSESDYYPWGGELQFTNGDSNHYKFTGKERDSETGLDYFGARYYSNGLGRFITPDWSATPVPVPYADLTDPQSLNQYSYVRNLPTTKADPDGHCFWDLCIGEVIVIGITASEVLAAASTGAVLGATAGSMQNGRAPTGCYGPCFADGPLPGTPSWNRMMADFDKQRQAYNQSNSQSGSNSGQQGTGNSTPADPNQKPSEPYNRDRHYGKTPTKADRAAVGGESADHDPPLVKRYYQGDPARGEEPGHTQTDAQRRASANDRTRMQPSTRNDQNKQGGQMSHYSKQKKKEHGL
jgi:RHS repeat-associated protein